ncbi:MAG: YceI family protein, partial [Pseudomonadota bacterium]
RFRTVDAKLDLNAEAPAESSVNVTIAANSIDTGVDVFDGHMNSADWLDTETYPEITFVSTALEQSDAGTGTLTGDLTIKGVTKPVTLDVTLIGAGPHPLNQKETVGVEATGTVLRSDFGLGNFVPAVGDEVSILISGEFNKVDTET